MPSVNKTFAELHGRGYTYVEWLTTRPVYRDDTGRQYVLDDDGEPVYGVWLHLDEYQEPVVIELPS
jgi:hypothetical protein